MYRCAFNEQDVTSHDVVLARVQKCLAVERQPRTAKPENQAFAVSPKESNGTGSPSGGTAIKFSGEELLRAQQKGSFCKEIACRLEETDVTLLVLQRTQKGPSQLVLLVVPNSYLLDHDGLLLRYIATEDESIDPLKVVIPKIGDAHLCVTLTMNRWLDTGVAQKSLQDSATLSTGPVGNGTFSVIAGLATSVKRGNLAVAGLLKPTDSQRP